MAWRARLLPGATTEQVRTDDNTVDTQREWIADTEAHSIRRFVRDCHLRENAMEKFVITDKTCDPITDWRAWTRPKRDYHWRAGRSAMELARAWFVSPVPVCPTEIASLLDSHPGTAGVTLTKGIPEHVTSLPERGEGRNHDLLLLGHVGPGSIVISIEAKVDEPFGETIGAYWRRTTRTARSTRAPQRIEALLTMVFGTAARPDTAPWDGLRYQLLTAVAGTAIEASSRQAAVAAVLIHEFHTEKLNREKADVNARDFQGFVSALVGMPAGKVATGQLYGPATLQKTEHLERPVRVLIGKAVFLWE